MMPMPHLALLVGRGPSMAGCSRSTVVAVLFFVLGTP
jgi:hypothetical protein